MGTAIFIIAFAVDAAPQNSYRKLTFSNGDIYLGETVDNGVDGPVAHGSGTYYYTSKGTVFKSDSWNYGFSNEGIQTWTSGPFIGYKYTGKFEEIQHETDKTPIWTDGEWVFEGQGSLEAPSGKIVEGIWKQGNLKSSHGKLTYPNGNVYVGEIVMDEVNGAMAHGSGTYYYTSEVVAHQSIVFKSYSWYYDVSNRGTMTWTAGTWVFEGRGTLRAPSGEIWRGTWKQGKLIN